MQDPEVPVEDQQPSDKLAQLIVEECNEPSVHDKLAQLILDVNEQKKNSDLFFKNTLTRLKDLDKNVKKMKPKKKPRVEGATPRVNGLAIPVIVSEELKAFLNLTENEYARKDITSLVTVYIKENNLQNPKNGREILVDETEAGLKLKELLKPDQPLSFFNLQRLLNKHYTKKPVEDLPSTLPEPPVEPAPVTPEPVVKVEDTPPPPKPVVKRRLVKTAK